MKKTDKAEKEAAAKNEAMGRRHRRYLASIDRLVASEMKVCACRLLTCNAEAEEERFLALAREQWRLVKREIEETERYAEGMQGTKGEG